MGAGFAEEGELTILRPVRSVQPRRARIMENRQRRFVQIALVVIGIVFLCVYPLMRLWPSDWVWMPKQYEYEQMMIGVYGTLGVFLIWASRRPEAHLSLIWFTFWSRLIHGIIMGTQAIVDPSERGHLIGDVARGHTHIFCAAS